MGKLGQIPTPEKYVKILLDSVGYKSDIFGKKVLENSCGDGNVLAEIVRRYIRDCQQKNISIEAIRSGLENDIVAYEIDRKAIVRARLKLDNICLELGITPARWNINCKDYLKQKDEKYDYIIGNPPYITYHDLSTSQREFLNKHFLSCKNGRFDYSYAFIEKSLNELSDGGSLAYLIPFSIFRNKYAEELRRIIKPTICELINYTGVGVFPDRTIGSSIIICRNSHSTTLTYKNYIEKVRKKLSKHLLGDKWLFENTEDDLQGKEFGEYFDVLNCVATLKNNVYIIKDYTENDSNIVFGNYKFEKELMHDAVSPRSKSSNRHYKIIFPYSIKNSTITNIPEREFKATYPNIYSYLKQNKNVLSRRSMSPGSFWYEYGRSQALTSVFKDKLIMPMIVSGRVRIHLSCKNEIPYAGYYIVPKTNQFTLMDAARILESDAFYDYVKVVGTPTTRDSYRISVSDIKQFHFI